MPHINLICVGGLKEDYWKAACAEYIKRMSPWSKINVVELPEERLPNNPSAANINAALDAEGQRIFAKLPAKAYLVAMCIEGKQSSSQIFAQTLSNVMSSLNGTICYVIGGSHGLSSQVKERANDMLSLSQMTFPHMLARVLLLEQLYRSLSILNGGRYHK
jgi:23S rRNA (pseudouridine1915-N3)-methyltransferase